MRILLIGYGNPGRGDDGLGPALAGHIRDLNLPGVDVESDFQLNIENAFDVKGYTAVYFLDAAAQGREPFEFRTIAPEDPPLFSSHAVSPEGILALAKQLFGISLPGHVLAVRGYEFDVFGAEFSPKAARNLEAAKGFLECRLRRRDLKAFAGAAAMPGEE